MKPLIEKPFDQVMKFFTPELFVRFNSADDEEADCANEEWEAAILAYRKHLDGLRDLMPSQVKRLADLCLHDAEVLAREQRIEPFFLLTPFEPFPFWSGLVILSIRQNNEIISLIYSLWDRLREYMPNENWPFSKLRTHWLYDEVDVSPNHRGMFLHRVLLSDGTIMEIPFLSALIHSFPLEEDPESHSSRQSA
jgi:hypothetical protein